MPAALPKPAPLTYAKAGVTNGWQHILVLDRDDGDYISKVFEVNSIEGWLVRAVTDDRGLIVRDAITGKIRHELLRGRFAILIPTSAR